MQNGESSRFLSIIVPIYNAQDYIHVCLDSLLKQNYDDYEIICVNDGSTDNTLSILTEYEKNNQRIKVIDKENGGVSSARNSGIQSACGKWIWFVDSDDYIPFNCLGYLLSQISEDIDYIAFDYDRTNKIDEVEFNEAVVNDLVEIDSTVGCLTTFPTKNYGNSPVSYIFRKELILKNNICFDCEMKYAEDTKFVFEYKMNSRRAKLVDGVFYYYFQNPSSAMHTLDYNAHFNGMNKLLTLYSSCSKKLQDKELKQIVDGKCIAAEKAVLFDLLFYIKDYNLAKETISEYENMGIYPYKKSGIRGNKNKKQMLIGCIYNLLRHKRLYLLLVKIFSVKK